jgi:type IV pilus assembly protein PilY1
MTHQQLRNHPHQAIATAVAAALIAAAAAPAAACTDIADVPLASSSTAAVKPNIMYVLDDSGSMDSLYMPDEMSSSDGKATFRNHLCNTIYYNPAVFYPAPPQLANGKRFPLASFTAAKNNGYDTASTATTDLSTAFKANSDDSSQPAYYYVLSSGTPPASPLDAACRGSAPNASSSFPHTPSGGGLSWTKVRVTTTSGPGGTDERQNFANWYSYYRSRLMMMKGASGRAFVTLSGSYRIGLITINPYVSGSLTSKYLRIADFDSTQKQGFLDKLYAQSTNGSTPLREALSRTGWIYAGQLGSGLTTGIPAADDPVQYSCQQNFALLTTDGYWNGNRGLDLAGNPVGNQDADLNAQQTAGDPAKTVKLSPRPIYDSGFTSTVTDTTTTREYFYTSSGCSSGRTRIRYNQTIEQRVRTYAGTELVSDQTTSNTSNNNNYDGCERNPDPLPSPNPSVTTTTATAGSSGGSTNSLADVAQYYYRTDLRSGMADNVPESGPGIEDDRAPWQHMTTFTMGLGIFGELNFISNYKSNPDPNTDFNKLRTGALNWPSPPDSTDNTSDPAKADDLWHAAVNGRGVAFTASNPDSVVVGLNEALAGVNARVASAAAAATSNLEPVAGDNFAYTASYETVKWQGELQAREIDLATGLVNETPIWSAQAKLDALVRDACDTRTIHLFRAGASNNLVPFKWNTDTCGSTGVPLGTPVTTLNATEQAFFDSTAVSALSQWPSMTDGSGGTVNQRADAVGANLVNFLRGQRGKETFIPGTANRLYRAREHVLGDIVNAQPLFVKRPFANYTDAGYDAYKSAYANRTPMVYVAANDGMLHAFYAGLSTSDPYGGIEAWAFIPTMVLPSMRFLADNNYANLHRYLVDGTPVAGDIYDAGASQWKTIVVGGLNKGGQGYYALDVTDPANPKGLWEFKFSATCFDPLNSATWKADCNLGFSYGNPVITKLTNGTWVVMVTSGYNNVNGAVGDGRGFLYVLNAATGEIIKKIGTGTGDATTPSGLGKINNWLDDGLSDNTTERVYGVDLLGNVWRFDVNGAAATGSLAQLLTIVRDGPLPTGQPQPISTKPELAKVGGRPFVYVATGRYLGTSDVGTTQVQTIYAIHDPLTTTTPSNTVPVYVDLRTSTPPSGLQAITITNATIDGDAGRTAVCGSNCSAMDGWYADLPDSGERVNVEMKLQLGTLTVLSNVPGSSACTIGGYSYINFFDYTSGLPISPTTGMVGLKLADSLAVGLNVVRLPSGKTVAIGTTSDSKQRTTDVPIASPGMLGRRVSWREIGE